MRGLSNYFSLFIQYWFLGSNPTIRNRLKKEKRLKLNNFLREAFHNASVKNERGYMDKFEVMRKELALTDFDKLNKIEIAVKFFEKGHSFAANTAIDVLNNYQGFEVVKKHMKEALEKEQQNESKV